MTRGDRPDAIYVETLVRAPMELLWQRTQTPSEHVRWDLRFTSITHLGAAEPGQPQEFRYAVKALPGVEITGTGRSLGQRHRPDGTRTSALGWERDSALSPLGTGRGYWRYVPVSTRSGPAIRFLTGYDYQPGWGATADRLVRPLLGWATAWSFDVLRLWLERDQSPERSHVLAALDGGLRLGVVALAVRLARRGGRRATVLATAGSLLVAVLTPAPAPVPRASRCRRRPPDRASSAPPSTITQVTRERA